MNSIEIQVIDANANFVIGTDGLTVAGFQYTQGTTEKTFKRGQLLFKQTPDGGAAGSGFVDATLVAGQVAGIVINDITIPAGSAKGTLDLYTGGRFDGKKIYNIQTAAVQAHLDTFANDNRTSPFNMQYEKTFNFEISH